MEKEDKQPNNAKERGPLDPPLLGYKIEEETFGHLHDVYLKSKGYYHGTAMAILKLNYAKNWDGSTIYD